MRFCQDRRALAFENPQGGNADADVWGLGFLSWSAMSRASHMPDKV